MSTVTENRGPVDGGATDATPPGVLRDVTFDGSMNMGITQEGATVAA